MHEINPNIVAYFALIIWPVIALMLYSTLPLVRATLWTILGGYLLLPTDAEINFHMIPAFDKTSIPNIAALVCCVLFAGRLPKFFRGFGLVEALIVVVIVSPFITSMLNTDPIQIGYRILPGVGPYDALSAAARQFIVMIPFFLGRQWLRKAEYNVDIMRVLVIAGLVYSLPMLFEIRMSPQLSNWIYGYAPTSIITAFREGGWRPVVFLRNGLLVSFFAMTSMVAAATLWRTRTHIQRLSFPPAGITVYLGLVLVLCKTVSSFLYGALAVPLIRWTKPRMQLRVASILVIIALSYPLLRMADLVPTASILRIAYSIDAKRAASLDVRFTNEERLLQHAWERKWFGWGRYGRSRVYDPTGKDISLTDGYWVITMGTFGLVGFVGIFGLLGLPVFRAHKALKFVQSARERQYLAALALILALNIFDQLPNASVSPWTWLLVGSLLGRAEAICAAISQRHPTPKMNPTSRPVYGRQ